MKKRMKPVLLMLICPSGREADRIAAALLEQRLIACAKKVAVASRFRWQGSVQQAKETLLLMESRAEAFTRIESAIKKLHSHHTFVLVALPISRTSAGVKEWISQGVTK